MLEVMRRVLLCMLEDVEGELCLLTVLEVMRCMLLWMLDAVEDGLSFGVSKFDFSLQSAAALRLASAQGRIQ